MSCDCELQIELINPQEWYNANLQRLLENEQVREKQEKARQDAESEREKYFERFKDDMEAGIYNSATFTPHVNGGPGKLTVSYTNDKGYENPPDVEIGIDATVDEKIGHPAVSVEVEGTDVTFAFTNLRGQTELVFLDDDDFIKEVMG